jgi:proteasome accessory factor C
VSELADNRLGRRLRRILLLLPYAIKHPGVTIGELSRKFGVAEEDLVDDLNLVFLCGLPGYGPGDLIDVTIDDDRVYVRMADYFAAPLRLTPTEALALYAGGATLAELPDMNQADALKRALGKLGRALGFAAEGPAGGLEVRIDPGGTEHLTALKQALQGCKRVRLEYLSASRGELSVREVDPWGLMAARGHWYLIAWDHSVSDERMFRVDRIKSVEQLASTADVPDDFDPDRYRGAFVGEEGQPRMTFEISPGVAVWFEDYYPIVSAEDLGDGWRRVELVASGERWAATLLLRLGRDARKVEPPEMMDAARSLAAAIAVRYDRPDASS